MLKSEVLWQETYPLPKEKTQESMCTTKMSLVSNFI